MENSLAVCQSCATNKLSLKELNYNGRVRGSSQRLALFVSAGSCLKFLRQCDCMLGNTFLQEVQNAVYVLPTEMT